MRKAPMPPKAHAPRQVPKTRREPAEKPAYVRLRRSLVLLAACGVFLLLAQLYGCFFENGVFKEAMALMAEAVREEPANVEAPDAETFDLQIADAEEQANTSRETGIHNEGIWNYLFSRNSSSETALPADFEDEVCGIADFDDIRYDEQSATLGFSVALSAQETMQKLKEELKGNGWNISESGAHAYISASKNEGMYVWLYAACVDIGAQCSVVMRYRTC